MSKVGYGWTAGFVLLVLVGADRAQAEVRVHERAGNAAVQIVPSATGPWGIVGRNPIGVLNPGGDSLGDGSPVASTHGAQALVAWDRAIDGTVQVALGDGATSKWQLGCGIADGDRPGQVSVVRLERSWVVALSGIGVDATTVVVGVSSGGHCGPPVVLDGHLEGLVAHGGSVWAITTLADGPHLDAWQVVFVIVPDNPEPIPDILTRVRLDSVVLSPDANNRPRGFHGAARIPSGHPASVPTFPETNAAATATPSPVRIFDDTRAGERHVVVTWWRSPFELAYVELDADGPVMPVRSVEAEGNAEFSPSLMNEALRDVWGD